MAGGKNRPSSERDQSRKTETQQPETNRFVWEPGDVEFLNPDDPRVKRLLAQKSEVSMQEILEPAEQSMDLPTISIERVYERDVDMLLAEELSISPDFATWLLKLSGHDAVASMKLHAVLVSYYDRDGESDLVAVYRDEDTNEQFALMIEDKVDATFQDEQAIRYRRRGQTGVERGEWSAYRTLLCAPTSYLDRHKSEVNEFDRAVSFEDIRSFFLSHTDGLRSEFRARMLELASPRGVSAYVRQQDPITDAFWRAVHQLARTEYRELELRDAAIASGGTWRVMHPADLPKNVTLNLKGYLGYVDLSFNGPSFDQVAAIVRGILDSDASIHLTGASVSIRLLSEPFQVSDKLDAELDKVRTAFVAAKRLLDWYRKHRSSLAPLSI